MDMGQTTGLLIQLHGDSSKARVFWPHYGSFTTTLYNNFEESSAKSEWIPLLAMKLGDVINNCITIQRSKKLRHQALLQDMETLEGNDSISYHLLGTLQKRNSTKTSEFEEASPSKDQCTYRCYERYTHCTDLAWVSRNALSIKNFYIIFFCHLGTCTSSLKNWVTNCESSKEKEAVFTHLKRFIIKKELPGKLDCLQCIQKSSPVLDNREWTRVKYFVKKCHCQRWNAKKRNSIKGQLC